jgi:hypothetical protein
MTTHLPVLRARNRLAIVSLVMGLLSFSLPVFFYLWGVLPLQFLSYEFRNALYWLSSGGGIMIGIAAVVVGIIALKQIRTRNMPGKCSAITGIVMGSIGIISVPLIIVITVILLIYSGM